MFYGLLDLNFWGYFIVLLVSAHITLCSVTIFLHRCQSHRALELHPIISHCFRFWLWLTTGMVTKAWAAIHRKHHARVDTVEDPHSPQIHGIWKMLWEGTELYRLEAKNQETIEKFGYGTPNDWLEQHLYARHCSAGIFILLALDIVLFGIPGITLWALHMMIVPFFAAGIINGVGHFWGYRNFEVPDASRNIIPWGIFICGEELHNNHHAYGASAKLSAKWYEFDLGWFYIKLLAWFGLAKIKRIAPVAKCTPNKKHIDLDTLRAVITTRFQLLAEYTHNVIIPTLKEERLKAGKASQRTLKRAKALLTKEDALISTQDKQLLMDLLVKFQEIREVYQFRKGLQAIWEKTSASQKELIAELHEWCKQAEASRSQLLRDFAERVRSYSLPAFAV